MKATTVKCPNCGNGVPIPPDLPEAQETRAVCPNCGVSLKLQRKQRPAGKARDGSSTTGASQTLRIPGYEIIGRLGRGGMASVYSAVQASSGRLVALKVLPPSASSNPDLVLRFDREARLLATITHPNVVGILDRGKIGTVHYLVMEYVAGQSLSDRLQSGPMTIPEVVEIVTRVSEAIQHCHDHGLVHRDLKPGNVLLGNDGHVRVTDFGISGLLRRLGDITEQGVMIGTPQYVAPEQLRDGSRIDHRADQYSLAVMTYEMLTNSLPVGVFEPASTRNPNVASRTDEVIHRALARDPADRYGSIREFAYEIRKALLEPPEKPSPSQRVPSPLDATQTAMVAPPVKPTTIEERFAAVEKKISGEGELPGMAAADAAESDDDLELSGGRSPSLDQADRDDEDETPDERRQGGYARFVAVTRATPPTQRSSSAEGRRRLSKPSRFALIGLAGVLVVGLVSVARIAFRPATAEEASHETLLGGVAPPSQLSRTITEPDDFRKAPAPRPVRVFLIASRLESGQWAVSPDFMQSAGMEAVLRTVPVHLTDSGLAGHDSKPWRLSEVSGAVILAQGEQGAPYAALSAVSSPEGPAVMLALGAARRVVADGLADIPSFVRPDQPNLLSNGDFSVSPVGVTPLPSWTLEPAGEERSRFTRLRPGAGETGDGNEDAEETRANMWRAILGGLKSPQSIRQTIPVEPGRLCVLSFSARRYRQHSGWIKVSVRARAGAGKESADRPGGSREAWAMWLALDPVRRRHEVLWAPPPGVAGSTATVAFSVEGGMAELADVWLQAIPESSASARGETGIAPK